MTDFMIEGKCHSRSVLPSCVPKVDGKGERAGGQHLRRGAGDPPGSESCQRWGGAQALNVLTFLILISSIHLYFREQKIFSLAPQEGETQSLAPACPGSGPAFSGGPSNPRAPAAPAPHLSWLLSYLSFSL